mmetsp:Transcript_14874/g.20695  ORF Transcript_14874/g.20695 Transcript_14874/m.20695 type:complete len:80 (-) Transcript_14874:396-635(-)
MSAFRLSHLDNEQLGSGEEKGRERARGGMRAQLEAQPLLSIHEAVAWGTFVDDGGSAAAAGAGGDDGDEGIMSSISCAI